jgi:5'-deoxynucleotidase YfbR-like HD superfamily hydrolase
MNPMGVNPEQVKNAIKLIEAKIGMQEEKLAALFEYSRCTRKLVAAFVRSQTRSCDLELTWWESAQEKQEKAERSVIQVQIAELKSQLAINQFMLEEAQKQGSGLITQ